MNESPKERGLSGWGLPGWGLPGRRLSKRDLLETYREQASATWLAAALNNAGTR